MFANPRRRTLLAAGAATLVGGRMARAADAVRIGVLGDQSGPYSDSSGPGALLAAQMAAKDFGGNVLGWPSTFAFDCYRTEVHTQPLSLVSGTWAS